MAATVRRGAVVGAFLFLAFFGWCLATHLSFSVMGVSDPELSRLARSYLLLPSVLFQLKVLLLYLAIGTGGGIFSALAIHGVETLRQKPFSRSLFLFLTTAFLFLLHLFTFGRSMVKHPQLYSEFFYEKGGFWQALQIFCTDRLGLWPFSASLAVAVLLGAGLGGVALVRQLGRKSFLRLLGVFFLLLGLAALLLLVSRISSSAPAPNVGPNLLLLIADSIRPDRLSISGYPRDTSPRLDALARTGVRFDQAYVQLPRTFPSVVSAFTGQYPFEHGITSMFPSVAARQKKFAALPRILKKHGWVTAVTADYAGDIFPRIDLGFDFIDAPHFSFFSLAEIRGLEIHTHLLPYVDNPWGRKLLPILKEFASLGDPAFVARDAQKWLRRLRQEERFFLTVFMSCSHFPYSPPWPYYKRYTMPGYRGWSKYSKINRINVEEKITAEDIAQINGLFDGALRATDDAVAEILAELSRLGLEQNTVVVFMSDHGENLYEGGNMMGHGDHLRGGASLRFPLIISDPRRRDAGRQITARVRQIDLFPTLLELLDVPSPPLSSRLPPEMAPVSLVPYMDHPDRARDLPVYAETGLWFVHDGPGFFQKQRLRYPDVTGICWFEKYYHQEIVLRDEWWAFTEIAKHRMLIDAGWKAIYRPEADGVKWELYALASDPEEEHDLAETRPDQLARLQQRLTDFLSARPDWTIAGGWFLPAGEEAP